MSIELVSMALAYSSCIALTAGGITIIYMATRTFNFTHASMVAWPFYIVFTFYTFYGGNPYYYIPLAALFSGMLGVFNYIFVNRRLLIKEAGMVTLMMSTLGIDLIYFAFINIYADFLSEVYKLYSRQIVLKHLDFFVGPVRGAAIVSLIVVFAVLIGLHVFLKKTKFGTAVRATIENPQLAKIQGINPDVVYLTAWFIGGALAGLGGGLLTMIYAGYPAVGMSIIVTMFAGAIVGGLYSVYGSLLGGFLVGLSEYIGIYILSVQFGGWVTAYRMAIPLAVMVIALLFFPEGLAGIKWEKITRRFGILRGGKG
jgi:branched-chain amino acid transport system permease protein